METLQRMCLKLVVSENRAQWKHRCQMCQNECGTLIQNWYVLKNMSLTVLKTLLLPYFWLNPQQIWNVHLSVTVSCWPVTTAACNPCSRAWCVTVFRFWLWATTPSRREIIRSTWDFEMYSGYRWAGKGLTLIFFPSLFPTSPFPKSFPSPRLTHDISLDEFEDDDLSEITEITDECGMSLNCNGPDIKVSCLHKELVFTWISRNKLSMKSSTFQELSCALTNALSV